MRKCWIVLILIGLIVTSTGCSEDNYPEDVFASYLSSWEEMDFEAMYGYLSKQSMEAIDKQKFIERYENIYSGMNVSSLQVESLIEKKEKEMPEQDSITFDFRVSMETLAGPIEFTNKATLVNEENDRGKGWYIDWEPSLIFPSMEEGEQVSVQMLKAARGEIRDRHGSGLAINAKANVIGIVPSKLGENPDESKKRLANLLDVSVEEIDGELNASWVKPELFVPIRTLPIGEQDLQEYLAVPGVAIQEKVVRTYPFGEAAAHLTGYVREINAEQLSELQDDGYTAGDFLGQIGLEFIFEEELRGNNGGHIFIKNADGSFKETVAKLEPVPGKNIQLTIDAILQAEIYQQLSGDAGTAVALNPNTGSVLSLVSTPSFDPNAFVRGLSKEQWKEWSENPDSPFLNRFTNRYTPGSVFKTITAAIGLKTGVTSYDGVRRIEGLHWAKDESWGDYYVTRVHEKSSVDLKDAFVFSDNIYFAQEALELGTDAFLKEANMFGFEEEIEFSFPISPSTLSNDGIKSEIQLADTAYGQGEVMMSPIHLAAIYTAFSNNGNVLYPFIIGEGKRQVWKKNLIKPDIVKNLNKYLIQVVEDPAGTAHGVFIPGMSIAGKTGTAEIKSSKDDQNGTENGWFIGFNSDNPELLLTMMIEDVKQRGGSSYTISKVRDIFEFYRQ
ncbi:penicillin-binding transpeptidase domain-containing protein [Ornithinibacillus sp. BX22]|uniref:serine-type D-Ala-D-Ala carboxypeptidase n=1 Tax=Ornithinibacillus hominis TaxID=2763055 RepID=A0A923L827_9BACI|nr:penicillin-binding transpeptidase domain-containing protein [Ornithinibacillus hominis]MBC5638236.1 penicillin-binding transpeptidase domain-containing protein [Ornithinibacillus hominis]